MTIEAALNFLEKCERRKTVNRRYSSYSWKHIAEEAERIYTSNENFVRAAQQLGFTLQRFGHTSSYFINIAESATKIGDAK